MVDLDMRLSAFQAAPAGCGFLLVVENSGLAPEVAAQPEMSVNIAALAQRELSPWRTDHDWLVKAVRAEGPRLAGLGRGILARPEVAWWFGPLDRRAQRWISPPMGMRRFGRSSLRRPASSVIGNGTLRSRRAASSPRLVPGRPARGLPPWSTSENTRRTFRLSNTIWRCHRTRGSSKWTGPPPGTGSARATRLRERTANWCPIGQRSRGSGMPCISRLAGCWHPSRSGSRCPPARRSTAAGTRSRRSGCAGVSPVSRASPTYPRSHRYPRTRAGRGRSCGHRARMPLSAAGFTHHLTRDQQGCPDRPFGLLRTDR